MSNSLKVSLQTTFYSLDDRGWSRRRIARELGIDRETVGRCLRLAKPVISTAGFEEASEVKPTIWITGNGVGRKSQCEALAEVIMAKARSGGEFLRLLKIAPQRPFTVNVFTGVKSGEEDP